MVQGGEKKGERTMNVERLERGKQKKRKIVQGVKRKKRRKIIYCGKVRKVETQKKKNSPRVRNEETKKGCPRKDIP